jgi:hypothetical protein
MLGAMKVLGGVLVFRRIAAADVAALEAESQVHPDVAGSQALLTTVRRVGLPAELLRRDAVQMTATVHGHACYRNVTFITHRLPCGPYNDRRDCSPD